MQRWYIADPANPARPATVIGYPAAGTPNADVSLLLARLDGGRAEIGWDRAAFPYLVTVSWEAGDPLIVVQSRDQRRLRLLRADPATGATTLIREDADERWVDIVPGVPARTGDGRIVWTADAGGARRLLAASAADHEAGAAAPLTPASLQVREVCGVDGDMILFTASGADPAEVGLWCHGPAGLREISPPGGVHGGTRAGGTTVLVSRTLAEPGAAARVLRDGAGGGPAAAPRIASHAERPALPAPHPDLFSAGPRQIRSALLLPSWHRPGSARLPVLLDPYGGPHAQRVLAMADAFHTSQWFAEQGFAVLVADGRGTPGRGPGVGPGSLARLRRAGPGRPGRGAARGGGALPGRGHQPGGHPGLVLRRVPGRPGGAAPPGRVPCGGGGRTGHALAAVRHPLHRTLPGPPGRAAAGVRGELTAGRRAPAARPLLLIHGLADDNVVAAHTLRFSSALLAAGRPHSVLPLSGVTHMTPQEEVAENLLLLQVDFLRRALGMPDAPAGQAV